jgi:hypothetical protein
LGKYVTAVPSSYWNRQNAFGSALRGDGLEIWASSAILRTSESPEYEELLTVRIATRKAGITTRRRGFVFILELLQDTALAREFVYFFNIGGGVSNSILRSRRVSRLNQRFSYSIVNFKTEGQSLLRTLSGSHMRQREP